MTQYDDAAICTPAGADANPRVAELAAARCESSPLGPTVVFLPACDGDEGPIAVVAWPGPTPLVFDVVPLFEQFRLWLARAGERVRRPDGAVRSVLQFVTSWPDWDDECAALVEQALPAAASPSLVGDPFRRLLVTARLPWADLGLLRAAANLRQGPHPGLRRGGPGAASCPGLRVRRADPGPVRPRDPRPSHRTGPRPIPGHDAVGTGNNVGRGPDPARFRCLRGRRRAYERLSADRRRRAARRAGFQDRPRAPPRSGSARAYREIFVHAPDVEQSTPADRVDAWLAPRTRVVRRVHHTVAELRTVARLDIAMTCTALAALWLLTSDPDRPSLEGTRQ